MKVAVVFIVMMFVSAAVAVGQVRKMTSAEFNAAMDARLAVPLEGLIDFDKERERLATQINKLAEEKTRLDAQLSNANFVERAPADKVTELRERSGELEHQIDTLNNNLEALN